MAVQKYKKLLIYGENLRIFSVSAITFSSKSTGVDETKKQSLAYRYKIAKT